MLVYIKMRKENCMGKYKNMIITLSGDPASGKGTVSKELLKKKEYIQIVLFSLLLFQIVLISLFQMAIIEYLQALWRVKL